MSDHFWPLLRNFPSYSESGQRPYNILRSLYNHSIISLFDLHHYQSQLLEVVRLQLWTLSHHASHTGFCVIPLTCEGQFSLGPFTFAVPCAQDNFCLYICLAWFLSFCNILLQSHFFIKTFPESPIFLFTLPFHFFAFKNVFPDSTENVLFIYPGISLYPHENVSSITERNFILFFFFIVLSSMTRKVSGT